MNVKNEPQEEFITVKEEVVDEIKKEFVKVSNDVVHRPTTYCNGYSQLCVVFS